MPKLPAGDWISVSEAARVLGLRPHTVYELIDKGDLGAEVIAQTDRPKRRRSIRLRRHDVDDFIERFRVRLGESVHLYPDWPGTGYR